MWLGVAPQVNPLHPGFTWSAGRMEEICIVSGKTRGEALRGFLVAMSDHCCFMHFYAFSRQGSAPHELGGAGKRPPAEENGILGI